MTDILLNSSYWSDVDINLTKQTDGDITRDIDIEAIKNSLTNICTTLVGSRRMLPNFATNIQYLLFEPISKSTANLIAKHLIDSIRKWDDRISLTGFDIIADYDNNQYKCKINFTIKNISNLNIVETVAFVLTQV